MPLGRHAPSLTPWPLRPEPPRLWPPPRQHAIRRTPPSASALAPGPATPGAPALRPQSSDQGHHAKPVTPEPHRRPQPDSARRHAEGHLRSELRPGSKPDPSPARSARLTPTAPTRVPDHRPPWPTDRHDHRHRHNHAVSSVPAHSPVRRAASIFPATFAALTSIPVSPSLPRTCDLPTPRTRLHRTRLHRRRPALSGATSAPSWVLRHSSGVTASTASVSIPFTPV